MFFPTSMIALMVPFRQFFNFFKNKKSDCTKQLGERDVDRGPQFGWRWFNE
jgi:hypothetical protein